MQQTLTAVSSQMEPSYLTVLLLSWTARLLCVSRTDFGQIFLKIFLIQERWKSLIAALLATADASTQLMGHARFHL
jgi:hypothetical protein